MPPWDASRFWLDRLKVLHDTARGLVNLRNVRRSETTRFATTQDLSDGTPAALGVCGLAEGDDLPTCHVCRSDCEFFPGLAAVAMYEVRADLSWGRAIDLTHQHGPSIRSCAAGDALELLLTT
jgi:hypothetical protein